MKRGFAGYNGRYLGNLLAVLITRSVMAKTLVIAVGVVWLFHVMYKNIYFKEEKKTKEDLFFIIKLCFSDFVSSGNLIPAELWMAGSICKFFFHRYFCFLFIITGQSGFIVDIRKLLCGKPF